MLTANVLINVAIIGCGCWGVNYIRVFEELPDSQVVAVCDLRRDRLDWWQISRPPFFLAVGLKK